MTRRNTVTHKKKFEGVKLMLTRREFIELCMSSTITLSLSHMLIPIMQEAHAQMKITKPPVVWIQLGTCVGDSISWDNGVSPDFYQLINDMLDLRYHWSYNSVDGDQMVKGMLDTVEKEAGNFWLVVEGSVITADEGRYNYVFLRDGEMVTGLAALKEFAPKAKHVIAVGACACWGGPAAAHPNLSGSKGVWDVITDRTVINIPGCPAHPDWMTGTFSHLVLYGMPDLDSYNRPKMFYGKTIHELCHRRQQFEDGIFAAFPGEEGCLFQVGCKGPVTHADCPVRQWNEYTNWPVKAGAPCIGCASPNFPDGMMPFYNHLPDVQTPAVKMNVTKTGATLGALAVGAVGTHLAASVFGRRIHKHYVDGTKPRESAPPENLEQVKQELDDLITQQKALLSETEKLEKANGRRRKKSFARKVGDFFKTEDRDGMK